jgi:hypothetical protein
MVTPVKHFSGAVFAVRSLSERQIPSDLEAISRGIREGSSHTMDVQYISYPKDLFTIIRTGPDKDTRLDPGMCYQAFSLDELQQFQAGAFTKQQALDAIEGVGQLPLINPKEEGSVYVPELLH